MGTPAWQNWQSFIAGEAETENADDELYSDRYFTAGAPHLGPYVFQPIHGSSHATGAELVRPAVRLHIGVHANLNPDVVVAGKLAMPDSTNYHGGTLGDELAALASLDLGVRLRDAGTSELSGIHDHGHDHPPIYLEVAPLTHPGRPGREHIPAALTRPADLSRLKRLAAFPQLDEHTQVQIARVARSYAAGLWWANEDQNQAWLHLVTAVEIAANHRQPTGATPEELVEDLWPELWADLASADTATRHAVCKRVSGQIRAGRKFKDFLVDCAPPPPEPRPSSEALNWDKMAAHARTIYAHRSDALHVGKPFPLPMLDVPRVEGTGAVAEVSPGLNTGAVGALWSADEYPMLLSTFEHIARGSLLTWWDECAAAASKP